MILNVTRQRGVHLVLVEAPHVGVLPGEGGDQRDLVQAHQARAQDGLHVTGANRHLDRNCQQSFQSKLSSQSHHWADKLTLLNKLDQFCG